MAAVIVAGVGAPFGKFGDAFKEVPAITINKRQACPWTIWTLSRSRRPLPRWR
jgi:hypothetical protein